MCVVQSSSGSFSQRLWLGVAASCVSLYRPGEAEALESLPITQICSYGVSDSNTFTITATDRHMLFHTSQVLLHILLQSSLLNETCSLTEPSHTLVQPTHGFILSSATENSSV